MPAFTYTYNIAHNSKEHSDTNKIEYYYMCSNIYSVHNFYSNESYNEGNMSNFKFYTLTMNKRYAQH